MGVVLGTGLSPVSLVTGDMAALFEQLHSCLLVDESWQGTQLLVKVVASYLSEISLGCQAPSEENIMDDQLGLLWASFRSRSTVW